MERHVGCFQTTCVKPRALAFAIAALGAACSDDPGACLGGATVAGVVQGSPGRGESLVPLAGAEVCHVVEGGACARTDAAGRYTLSCLGPGDATLRFTAEGYAPSLSLRVITETTHALDITLFTDAENAAIFDEVGVVYPLAGHGIVTINEVAHLDGTQFSAEGALGPFYSDVGLAIDPEAVGTFGDGFVFFVAPVGELRVDVSPPPGTDGLCGQASGGFSTIANGFTVPVVEGTETSVLAGCVTR